MARWLRTLICAVLVVTASGIAPALLESVFAADGHTGACAECPGCADDSCPPVCPSCVCSRLGVPTGDGPTFVGADLPTGEVRRDPRDRLPPSAPSKGVFHPPRVPA